MHIKRGSRLYVRIDHRVIEEKLSEQDFQDHLSYVENVAKERYFAGGGFSNTDGGMIIFEADNYEEAHKITVNDPLVERGIYRFELFIWDVVVLSSEET